MVGTAEHVVVVIGTPVDEHLNPDQTAIPKALAGCAPYLRDGQLLVLRSTVFPGVTALVEKMIAGLGVADRRGVLPGADRRGQGDDRAVRAAADRLRALAAGPGARGQAVLAADRAASSSSSPEEAELAKLFTNVWRYIKFAAANQFYMMANDRGLDFERIRQGLTQDYPRAADMPGAGFAAGPCLFKDTMQLAAFNNNNFTLGHTAMTINEGLPLYLVHRLEQRFDLSVDDRRHPRDGVQGRVRRHPVEPVLQAQADPRVQGRRGALRRPVRHRRPEPAPAGRGHRAVRPADHRHAAPASTATW